MVTITSITLNKDVKDDISTYEEEGAGKGRGGAGEGGEGIVCGVRGVK